MDSTPSPAPFVIRTIFASADRAAAERAGIALGVTEYASPEAATAALSAALGIASPVVVGPCAHHDWYVYRDASDVRVDDIEGGYGAAAYVVMKDDRFDNRLWWA